MREALDYLKQLGQFLLADVYTWNDSSTKAGRHGAYDAMTALAKTPREWGPQHHG
jgi:hypothetical protein